MVPSAETQKRFWEQVQSDRLEPQEQLAQGDFLSKCSVPMFSADLDEAADNALIVKTRVDVQDVIVMTQSCDLENKKAPLVACCPIYTLARYEIAVPKFQEPKAWEMVRTGKVEGLHLLGSLADTQDKWAAYVVDFRSIFSLPEPYLLKHAAQLGPRHRLQSPFLEHFSQSFARFFMRVGLPSAIPSFNIDPKRPPVRT